MKKTLTILICTAIILCFVAGCSQKFEKANSITVITREEGSGTRGAFTELFDIDEIFSSAIVNDKTGIVLATVSSDVNANLSVL